MEEKKIYTKEEVKALFKLLRRMGWVYRPLYIVFLFTIGLFIIGSIIHYVTLWYSEEHALIVFGFLSFIVVFVIPIKFFEIPCYKAKIKLKSIIEMQILPITLAEVFTDITYNRTNNDFVKYHLKQSKIPITCDTYTCNDHVKAKYRNVDLEFADVSLYNEHIQKDKDGFEQKVSLLVFRGQWLVLDFHKQLSTELLITEKAWHTRISSKVKSDIQTESTAFNDKFYIKTDVPHEAFYILTPHFMEYLLEMDKKAKADVQLSFLQEGKVYLLLERNHDLFELTQNAFKLTSNKMGFETLTEQIQNETKYVTEILDELLSSKTLFRADIEKEDVTIDL